MVNCCMPSIGLVPNSRPSWVPSKHRNVPASEVVTVGDPMTVGLLPPMLVVLSTTQFTVGKGARSGGGRSGAPRSGDARSRAGKSVNSGRSRARSASGRSCARSTRGRSRGVESASTASSSGASPGTVTGPSTRDGNGSLLPSNTNSASGASWTSNPEGASSARPESFTTRSGPGFASSGNNA